MEDFSPVTNDASSSVKSESKVVRDQQTPFSKPVDAASRTSTSSRSSSYCKTIIEAAARARASAEALKCGECDSENHCSAMHPDNFQHRHPLPTPQTDTTVQISSPLEVTLRCTKVCSNDNLLRSCSKVCLVRVFPRGQPERAIKMYAILDDQSNRSLVRSEFFHMFKVESNLSPYLMKTCAGTTEMTRRKATGFQIEAVNGGVRLDLPPLIECNEIMNNRSEIPTLDVALAHAHLKCIAPHISKLDPDAEMMVLLGRDMIRVHKV